MVTKICSAYCDLSTRVQSYARSNKCSGTSRPQCDRSNHDHPNHLDPICRPHDRRAILCAQQTGKVSACALCRP